MTDIGTLIARLRDVVKGYVDLDEYPTEDEWGDAHGAACAEDMVPYVMAVAITEVLDDPPTVPVPEPQRSEEYRRARPGENADLIIGDALWVKTGEAIDSTMAVVFRPDGPVARPEKDDTRVTVLADGREVPTAAVEALAALDEQWPGATSPQARPAIVATVLDRIRPEES